MNRILTAIRRPEQFAIDSDTLDLQLFTQLAGAATVGIASYGGVAHAAEGLQATLWGAGIAVGVAGCAWALAIPALVVLGALSRSKLSWQQALLASLVSVTFGGGAFLAATPVVVLLELAANAWFARHLIHGLIVCGVGGSAALIFLRVMSAVEGGTKPLHWIWISLFGTLFLQLSFFSQLFHFPV